MTHPAPIIARRSFLRLTSGLGLGAVLGKPALAQLFPEQGQSILISSAAPLIDMSGMESPYADNDPEPEPLFIDEATLAPQDLPEIPIGDFPENGVSASFLNANTNERMVMQFTRGRGTIKAADKGKMNWLLRDWRRNETIEIDPRAIQSLALLVAEVQRRGAGSEVRITSGYRSRATNDMLRSQGRKAARNSLHIKGMAIDLSFPGVGNRALAKLARELLPGGVGSYDSFVHIDSGPHRSWGQA